MDQDGSNVGGTEAGDLKSVIFGLHVFYHVDMDLEKADDQLYMGKLTNIAEKVIVSRPELQSDEGDRKFEVNPIDCMNGQDIVMLVGSESIDVNPGLNEASYMSWVEKFKQALPEDASDVLDLGHRRRLPDEKHHKAEAARKKAEEKKLSKWEALSFIICQQSCRSGQSGYNVRFWLSPFCLWRLHKYCSCFSFRGYNYFQVVTSSGRRTWCHQRNLC